MSGYTGETQRLYIPPDQDDPDQRDVSLWAEETMDKINSITREATAGTTSLPPLWKLYRARAGLVQLRDTSSLTVTTEQAINAIKHKIEQEVTWVERQIIALLERGS